MWHSSLTRKECANHSVIRHYSPMAQEKHQIIVRLSTMPANQFSDKEFGELEKLRDRLYKQDVYLKRVLDEKHLRFARYLREHGEIRDEL